MNCGHATSGRGQAVGRTALSAALDYFEAQGMMYSQIETLEANERGQRLYSRCGYREVARKVQYFTRQADRKRS